MAADLASVMADVDGGIRTLEASCAAGEPPLPATVERALLLVNRLMLAFAAAQGHALGEVKPEDDALEVFKVFVKGEPSLNAIRDNVRELVYYRNCVAADRTDALPARPATMAVRTLRHVYLYLRTRAIQEHGVKGS